MTAIHMHSHEADPSTVAAAGQTSYHKQAVQKQPFNCSANKPLMEPPLPPMLTPITFSP